MGEQEELIQYSISQQSRLDASFDADESVVMRDSDLERIALTVLCRPSLHVHG